MASNWIPEPVRRKICNRDNMRCAYCNETCVPATVKGMTRKEHGAYMRACAGKFATLDHIVARASVALAYGVDSEMYRDMLTDPNNLVCVCSSCNSSKKDQDLATWAKSKGFNVRNINRRIKARVARAI